MHDNVTDEIWTVAEVAQYLKMTTGAVYSMTRRRATARQTELPHFKLHGKALRFLSSQIRAYVNNLAAGSR